MKKAAVAVIAITALVSFAGSSWAAGKIDAKKEFQEHCAICHPDGGNTVNPAKTLKKKDLEANKVKSSKDIVVLMRKPGPGMTQFDAKTVSDREAKAIADYIMKTFK